MIRHVTNILESVAQNYLAGYQVNHEISVLILYSISTCDELASRPGRVEILLAAAFYSSSANFPPTPARATLGHLLAFSVPGVGYSQFYRGPGAGHLLTPGDPRAFDSRVFESAMEEFIDKDEAFVED